MASEKIERNRAERMLRKSTESAVKTIEYCIEVNKQSLLTVNGTNTTIEKLSCVYLHHTIAQTNMIILMEKIALSKSAYETTFFARMLALHLCEFLDDINTLIGREILWELSNVVLEEFVPVFKRLNWQFSLIKKENGNFLRTVRNRAAAHKTHKSLELAEFTQFVDSVRIFNIACQVRDISIQLILESTSVGNKLKTIYQMFNQLTDLWNNGFSKGKIIKLKRSEGY